MRYKVNDVVRLLHDMSEEGLRAGAVGVVIMEFFNPEHAYEVEFSDSNGKTIALLSLKSDQIAPYQI